MVFNRQSVVFGSANYWTSPYQVGSHAWARLFANHGWRVCYLSDPISPWHFLNSKNQSHSMEKWRLWRKGLKSEPQSIHPWVPLSCLTPLSQFPFSSKWVLNHWHHLTVPNIKRTLHHWNLNNPGILWIDSIRHMSWGQSLQSQLKVLRIADWSPGFRSIPTSLLNLEKEWVKRADLVITSAKTLEEKLRPIRGQHPMVTIRNGVDTSFWQSSYPEPSEYQSIPAPRIIYVGALDSWFNTSLVIELARALPSYSFVIIGQPKMNLSLQPDLPNLYWLGPRKQNLVRGYVQHADVGMIPFIRNELIDGVCPLKLYEYMACGLPVVSTRWTELEQMNSPAKLAVTTDDWIQAVQDSVQQKKTSASEKRMTDVSIELSYATSNDWSARWSEWLEATSLV